MTTDEKLPITIDGLENYQQKLLHGSASWLRVARQRAFDSLAGSAWPSMRDEEWKYTSLESLASQPWHLPSRHQLIEQTALDRYINHDDINVVLINGVLWADLSDIKRLPPGVVISPLSSAAQVHGSLIQETFIKPTANDTKFLWWLNQALYLDGAFIKIDKKVAVDRLIHIIHVTSSCDDQTIVQPRSFISVGEGAQASIMESHVGYSPTRYFSNAVCDIRIEANASLMYCKAESENKASSHVASTRIWQDAQSNLETFSFVHGAALVRNNLSILLKGEGTNTIMNGFYAMDHQQHVDNHTLLDIQQPHCTSYQLYKGILNDASRAVFNGKIYVHPDAQQTNGYQLNKHLLLGKNARVDTKPQLEIFADDVKCTHGATIGQLSDDEIFYLQSRCIPRATAIALLSKGFIDDIINTIKEESIRVKLHQLLAKKFPEVII